MIKKALQNITRQMKKVKDLKKHTVKTVEEAERMNMTEVASFGAYSYTWKKGDEYFDLVKNNDRI